MPALPSDIAAATRPAQLETRSDNAIKTRYPSARDGMESPAEGFFDNASDAQTALAQRAALIGTERRRMVVTINEAIWPTRGSGLRCWTLVSAEQCVSGTAMVTRMRADLDNETTQIEVLV